MKPSTNLYFECHITIDPVHVNQREAAQAIVTPHKFKLAKLLMQKGETLEEFRFDTFMTGHGVDYDDLKSRMVACITDLKAAGYVVRRYKIEDTLLDSRPERDPLGLLG